MEFALGWVACGAFAYAITLHHFDTTYPDQTFGPGDRFDNNLKMALYMAVMGPMGLIGTVIAMWFIGGRWGLKWTPATRAEARAAHIAKFPNLDVDEWVGPIEVTK